MRWLLVFLTCLFGSLALGAAAEKTSSASMADEEAIKQLEDEWATALVKADFTVIDRIVAPEWMVSTPDGQLLTSEKAKADLKDGTLKFEAFKVEELTVKVHGQTALVFGVNSETSTYKGKDVSGRYRFTDVFVKRDGKWVCIATHVSKVAKPDAASDVAKSVP